MLLSHALHATHKQPLHLEVAKVRNLYWRLRHQANAMRHQGEYDKAAALNETAAGVRAHFWEHWQLEIEEA